MIRDDYIRDIVVCGKEIWYKVFIARSTGIFRCMRKRL